MRIVGLVPDRVFPAAVRAERERWLAGRLDVDAAVESVHAGPDYVESATDQVASSPGVLDLGRAAHRNGADALAVLCMTDPAVDALRENVPCPVVGAAEASILLAAGVAQSAVVVTILESAVAPVRQRVRAVPGGTELIAAIDAIGIGIAAMRTDPAAVLDRCTEVSERLLDRTGADAVILGCTEMGVTTADELARRLGRPVIDPNVAAFALAAMLARSGIRTATQMQHGEQPWDHRYESTTSPGPSIRT